MGSFDRGIHAESGGKNIRAIGPCSVFVQKGRSVINVLGVKLPVAESEGQCIVAWLDVAWNRVLLV